MEHVVLWFLLLLLRRVASGQEEGTSARVGCSDRVCGRYCNEGGHCFLQRKKCGKVGKACTQGRSKIKDEIWKKAVSEIAKVQLSGSFSMPLFGSCAVVSSSQKLLEYKFGSEIDSFDAVLRMNMSPVKGFELQVGSRTDVAITNVPSWSNSPTIKKYTNVSSLIAQSASTKELLVIVQDALTADDKKKCCFKNTARSFRTKVAHALKSCKEAVVPRRHSMHCTKLDSVVLDAAWELICAVAKADPKIHCNYSPSSGLTTILYAISTCTTVKLFGFGLGPSRGHYYATGRNLAFEVKAEVEDIIVRAWSTADPYRLSIAGSNSTTPDDQGEFFHEDKHNELVHLRHHRPTSPGAGPSGIVRPKEIEFVDSFLNSLNQQA